MAPDGRILIYTDGLWVWNGRQFRRLCDENLALEAKLLAVDRFGRVFLEVVKGDYFRLMFDRRYTGTRGGGLLGSAGGVGRQSARTAVSSSM